MTMRPPDELDDPQFDRAWGHASNEEPPAALDDAIRAAARRDVGARPYDVASVPEATRPERWWFPLAAAATIGAIAIGLLQLSTSDRIASHDEPRVVSDVPPGAKELPPPSAPAPSPKVEPASPATEAPKQAESSAPVARPKPQAQPPRDALAARESKRATKAPAGVASNAASAKRADTGPEPFPAATPAPAAPPAPAPSKAEASASVESSDSQPRITTQSIPLERPAPAATGEARAMMKSRAAPSADESNKAVAGALAPERSEALPSTPPVAGAPPMATPQRAASALAADRVDPVEARARERATMPLDRWIALMRRLRDEQRLDELAKELAAFRSLHADANELLPPDLRDVRPLPQ